MLGGLKLQVERWLQCTLECMNILILSAMTLLSVVFLYGAVFDYFGSICLDLEITEIECDTYEEVFEVE